MPKECEAIEKVGDQYHGRDSKPGYRYYHCRNYSYFFGAGAGGFWFFNHFSNCCAPSRSAAKSAPVPDPLNPLPSYSMSRRTVATASSMQRNLKSAR